VSSINTDMNSRSAVTIARIAGPNHEYLTNSKNAWSDHTLSVFPEIVLDCVAKMCIGRMLQCFETFEGGQYLSLVRLSFDIRGFSA